MEAPLREEEVTVFLMTLLILAGVAVLWMAMQSRRRIREMEHRERLAMIERGLVPPPELDPALFERRTGMTSGPEPHSAARSRSIGVMVIGVGLGMMILITFAGGAPSMGVGIGGAFVVLGAAFYINGMLIRRQEAPEAPPANRPISPMGPKPPSDLAP